MGDTGIDEWRNAGFYHATNIQPQARALKIPAGDLQLHIAFKEDFRHLFRYRSGRFHATRTDKARYARRCDHCRTSDTKGFGNRAIAHIRVCLLLREAGEKQTLRSVYRRSKPAFTQPADPNPEHIAVAGHSRNDAACADHRASIHRRLAVGHREVEEELIGHVEEIHHFRNVLFIMIEASNLWGQRTH